MCKQRFREIQLLLCKQAECSNRELRKLLDEVPPCPTFESLLSTFSLIFGLSKYSNKEMLYFLDVFLRFRSMGEYEFKEIGNKIVELKFTPSEKDTESAILKYFDVINAILDDMSLESLEAVMSRYTFMLCNNVVGKAVSFEVFRRFKEFLRKKEHFLRTFIDGKMYKDIAHVDEFVIDFCEFFSDEEMVDAALECKSLRAFIIEHTRSRYLLQAYYSSFPKWYIAGMHDSHLPYLYYTLDKVGIYKHVSEHLHKDLGGKELLGTIDRDLECNVGRDQCSIRASGGGVAHSLVPEIEYGKDNPVDVERDVMLFNETGSPQHLFDKFDRPLALELLRYSEKTDLKQLGMYLCKLKNEPDLKIFTNSFEFLDMDPLSGLRTYLLSFHLLGEGQIIHRVVETYAEKYYLDNAGVSSLMKISKDAKTREFIFNLSFSFLVLNTKFHNSNIKVKPTFRDYMKDFTVDEIPESFDEERLESMFVSIRDNALEFPTSNKPTRWNYNVYKRICRKLDASNKKNVDDGEDKGMQDLVLPEDMSICSICRSEAHRRLFYLNFRQFFSLEPRTFYSICNKLELVYPFEEYLVSNKGDTKKFIGSFAYYLGMSGKVELYVLLFDVLHRIARHKSTGMFSDLNISFLKNADTGEERVLHQYKGVYGELVGAEVFDLRIMCEALQCYLAQNPTTGGGSNVSEERRIQKKQKEFINGVVLDILERNIDRLGDLSMLSDESLRRLLEKCVWIKNQERFCQIAAFVSREGLLALFRKIFSESPDFVNDRILEEFKAVDIYNDDGFHCVLSLQNNGIDMFDFVVVVKHESIVCRAINAREAENNGDDDNNESGNKEDHSRLEFVEKDMLNCYDIEERYEESLGESSNLFHFYVSSDSVLNQSKARSIHRSGCPMSQPLFSPENMDKRLIYMIKKADMMNNKDVTNYALWIVNLLSSSLPLLARFFVRSFGILLTLKDQSMVGNFIKIFYSRVCKVVTGSRLCCECGYSSLRDVEAFIELLLKYDLAVEKDFEFYLDGRRAMMDRGQVKCMNGELLVVELCDSNERREEP